MFSLPAILCKATPAACLLGLTLIITGCSAEQEQSEPVFTYVHGASGQSVVSLPQDLRRHQRTARTSQLRHAAPPPEAFTGGN